MRLAKKIDTTLIVEVSEESKIEVFKIDVSKIDVSTIDVLKIVVLNTIEEKRVCSSVDEVEITSINDVLG